MSEKLNREGLNLEEAHRILHEMGVRIIDFFGDLIFVKNRDSVYIACNESSEKFIGLKESDQIGKTDFDFFDRDIAETIQEKDRKIFSTGIEQRFKECVTYPNGKKVLMDTLKAPFYGPGGAIVGLVGISRDITEREKAEMALRESEQRFRTLAEATHEGIVITEHGWILDVNEQLTEILGFERSELLGQEVADLLPPEERDRVLGNILQGKESQIEHEMLCKDGSRRTVEAHGKTIAQQGRQLRITSIRDLTERKRVENALRETEQRLRHIVEYSTNLFYMHTTDHILTYVSPQSRQFFDCEPEEAMVRWTELITDNPVNRHAIEATQRAIDTGERQPTYQLECVGKKGRKIWVEVNETPLVENGKTVVIVGSLTDITERKRAEDALRKTHEELEFRVRERTEQLTSLTAELSLAEERERRCIATELHDQVGQTLIFSKIKLNSLSRELSSESFGKLVTEIREYLNQTIEGIRSLTFQLSPPLLYEVGLEAAVEWLGEELEEKYGVQVEVQDDGSKKPLAEEASVALYQMVRELLINVAKHANAKRVWVSVAKVPGKIKIIVADDGSGFDSRKGMRCKNKRNGFGLFNIHQRIEYLGGELLVESEIGQGTRVTLLLPLKQKLKNRKIP